MLQCKLSEGKLDSFVRDVKAAPDPQCVLYTDQRMSELVKFTTKQTKFLSLLQTQPTTLGTFMSPYLLTVIGEINATVLLIL